MANLERFIVAPKRSCLSSQRQMIETRDFCHKTLLWVAAPNLAVR